MDKQLAALAKKMKERRRLLSKVLDFFAGMDRSRVSVVRSTMHSCNVHTEREIEDFGGFTFNYETGQTMMGGNTMKVWYKQRFVLEFYFQAPGDEFQVHEFNEECRWVPVLLRVMKCKKTILTAEKRKKKREERQTQRLYTKKAQAQKVLDDALRLGFEV